MSCPTRALSEPTRARADRTDATLPSDPADRGWMARHAATQAAKNSTRSRGARPPAEEGPQGGPFLEREAPRPAWSPHARYVPGWRRPILRQACQTAPRSSSVRSAAAGHDARSVADACGSRFSLGRSSVPDPTPCVRGKSARATRPLVTGSRRVSACPRAGLSRREGPSLRRGSSRIPAMGRQSRTMRSSRAARRASLRSAAGPR